MNNLQETPNALFDIKSNYKYTTKNHNSNNTFNCTVYLFPWLADSKKFYQFYLFCLSLYSHTLYVSYQCFFSSMKFSETIISFSLQSKMLDHYIYLWYIYSNIWSTKTFTYYILPITNQYCTDVILLSYVHLTPMRFRASHSESSSRCTGQMHKHKGKESHPHSSNSEPTYF